MEGGAAAAARACASLSLPLEGFLGNPLTLRRSISLSVRALSNALSHPLCPSNTNEIHKIIHTHTHAHTGVPRVPALRQPRRLLARAVRARAADQGGPGGLLQAADGCALEQWNEGGGEGRPLRPGGTAQWTLSHRPDTPPPPLLHNLTTSPRDPQQHSSSPPPPPSLLFPTTTHTHTLTHRPPSPSTPKTQQQ